MKPETFEATDYKTKAAMWQHLEPWRGRSIISPRSRAAPRFRNADRAERWVLPGSLKAIAMRINRPCGA